MIIRSELIMNASETEAEELRRVSVRLIADQHRSLRLQAAQEDCSIQDLVARWIAEKLAPPPLPFE
jgi:predicted HicB family RNase H-like nuclease